MATKEQILDAWIMEEHLVEGKIDLHNKSLRAFRDENPDFYSEFNKTVNRYSQTHPKSTTHGVTLYIGIFDFDEVIQILKKKYGLNEYDDNIEYGKRFELAISFNRELEYQEEYTFYTEPAYIRRYNDVSDEKTLLDKEKEINEKIKGFFTEDTTQEDFNAAINTILQLFNASASSCRWAFYKNLESGAANLHSFFINDLETAKKTSSKSLDYYLFGKNPEDRVDLETKRVPGKFNEHNFEKILAPEKFPLGRFPSNTAYSLSFMQQIAVNLASQNDTLPIQSVNGPPGTGKTTLLKDIIADVVVQAAQEMQRLSIKSLTVSGEFPASVPKAIQNCSILVASANNGAVQNIVKELPKKSGISENLLAELVNADYFYDLANGDFQWIKDEKTSQKEFAYIPPSKDDDARENWGLFSVEGGRSENVNKIVQLLNRIYDYLSSEYRSQPDCYTAFEKEYQVLKSYQLKVKKDSEKYEEYVIALNAYHDCNKNYPRQVESRRHALEQIQGEVDAKCKELYVQKADIEQQIKLRQEQNTQNVETLVALNSALNSLKKPGFFARKEDKKQYKTAKRKIATQQNKIAGNQANVQGALNEQKTALNEVNKRIADEEAKVVKAKEDLENFQREEAAKIKKMKAQIDAYEASAPDVHPLEVYLPYEELQMHHPWYTEEYRIMQSRLFIAALKVRKQFLYENRNNIHKAAESLAKSTYLTLWAAKNGEEISNAWDWAFVAIPVLSTTFSSLANMFKYAPDHVNGVFMIDEAGQALPYAAVGGILRSRRVIAVGDPAQIKPVQTLENNVIEILDEHYQVGDKYLSESACVQTLADEASKYGFEKPDGSWIGIPLWVHRRCGHPMFDISNAISYDGYMVQGNDEDGIGVWYDIKGHARDKFVQEQADFVRDKILEIVNSNPDVLDNSKDDIVYVISPFKNVASHLAQELNKIGFTRRDEKGKPTNVGTVHTFQGKETDIVFLVLGADENSRNAAAWAVKEPNIINVAATRAKKAFYVVGDKDLYLSLNSPAALITYDKLAHQ